jgi:hypothetical protein
MTRNSYYDAALNRQAGGCKNILWKYYFQLSFPQYLFLPGSVFIVEVEEKFYPLGYVDINIKSLYFRRESYRFYI